ncbi:MAG: hypothetical protein J6T25_05315 [Bacilli bacterium]|nr:hypothetical protein [Bacilli bacterium]
MEESNKQFIRHFRIYFRNGHPAYIVDEEGNMYVFHRVTHSPTSGGKKNWKKKNPLKRGGNKPMYIVKKEERDKKTRFSPFQLDVNKGVDILYPDIKKAGRSQTDLVVNNNCPGTDIKTNQAKKHKRKQKRNKTKLIEQSLAVSNL